jgi:hypothetical protein
MISLDKYLLLSLIWARFSTLQAAQVTEENHKRQNDYEKATTFCGRD